MRTIRDDLTNLWNLLGNPSTFPFYLIQLPVSSTTTFDVIASLPKADKATAEKVSVALLKSDRLFNFDKYCVTKIGDKP